MAEPSLQTEVEQLRAKVVKLLSERPKWMHYGQKCELRMGKQGLVIGKAEWSEMERKWICTVAGVQFHWRQNDPVRAMQFVQLTLGLSACDVEFEPKMLEARRAEINNSVEELAKLNAAALAATGEQRAELLHKATVLETATSAIIEWLQKNMGPIVVDR